MENSAFQDNKTNFTIINTNARSLRPKIASFIDCFLETSATFGVVTETWFSDGNKLDMQVENLLLGSGINALTLNRPPGNAGYSHGGVAIMSRSSTTKMKPYSFPNPDNFEVLPVTATVKTIGRKFALIAAYMPPGYTVARGKDCLQHINDLVLDIKQKLADPYIVIMGDFNQWKIEEALADYPDVEEVITTATRENRRIDRVFVNYLSDVSRADVIPPLETLPMDRDGTKAYSDHKIQVVEAALIKKVAPKWEQFTCQPYTISGANSFQEEISGIDWSYVTNKRGSNDKAVALQLVLDDLMSRHFPTKKIRRKNNDLPWFNSVARKMVTRKTAIYRTEGKSPRWYAALEKFDNYMDKRQQNYLKNQRNKLTSASASRNFYKNVKAFKAADKPESFDVRNLRPSQTDQETADEVALFFNRISQEFSPLQPHQIPCTYDRYLPPLTEGQVEQMIRKCKKTASMVKGDIFQKLLNPCAAALSIPLTNIYNEILTTFVWPISWKREYVTVIPKKGIPEDFGDLRNISCTLLISKLFEAHILKYAQEEISLKDNQFGGVKGCSTTHMVIEVLQEVCDNAEDYRSATVLAAIDYAKAFNRVSYQHCLEAFRKKGSSTRIIRLLASFLTNRTMSVRVGSAWSLPLEVTGGCPQGSILGVFIFNTTTDDLEDKFLLEERVRVGLEEMPNDENTANPTNENTGENRGVVSSSPSGPLSNHNIDLSPIVDRQFRLGERHIEFHPNVVNVPTREPSLLAAPTEEKVGTQVLRLKPVKMVKYVDDNLSIEKLNFGTTPAVDGPSGKIKTKQAINTQNGFQSVSYESGKKGMVVNSKKTNLLCISDALNYKPITYIEDAEGNRINCKESMKVLGFTFSDKPTVGLHVEETVKGLRWRKWVLTHLKKIGFNNEELVKVHQSLLLPIADYCAPAYHSLTTDIHDQQLEQAQTAALRCIFGYGQSARKLRQLAGLRTLRERRIELCDSFARKCVASDRFRSWFPLNEARRSGRNSEIYKEFQAKNDRLKNSPLFYMRRRLNGKEGKSYGERNRIYRKNLNT